MTFTGEEPGQPAPIQLSRLEETLQTAGQRNADVLIQRVKEHGAFDVSLFSLCSTSPWSLSLLLYDNLSDGWLSGRQGRTSFPACPLFSSENVRGMRGYGFFMFLCVTDCIMYLFRYYD